MRDSPRAHPNGTFFVGREEEMEQLRSLADEAFRGSGRLVLLSGDPGIGKTRIVLELGSHAATIGFRVLSGRCHETGGAPAYWPWIQVMRGYAAACNPAELDAARAAGGSYIAQLGGDVREGVPSAAPASLDPQARFRLFDSAASLVKHAARTRPLLLVLEDIHAADTPSLLLLQFLAREIAASPLLVVATYRDVEVDRGHALFGILTDLAREPVMRRLTLAGLGEEDVGRYVEMAAGRSPSPALVAALHRRTEGNPFFLGEMVWLLLSEGELDAGGTGGPLTAAVPAGVRGVILRRLEGLSVKANRLLGSAAVIGREFDLRVLEGVSGLPFDEVVETLEEAMSARLVSEIAGSTGRYTFSHALLQETLYAELGTGDRIRLHRKVGAVLESVHRGNLEPRLPELAHHFLAAAPGGDVDKAIDYAVRAGNRALLLSAYEEAARHYEVAIQALDLRPQADAHRLFDLLLMLNTAVWGAGDCERARTIASQAVDVARGSGWRDRLATAALAFAGRPGGFGVFRCENVVISLLEEALAGLGEDESALRARLMARLAEELTMAPSDERRWALGRQAIELARRHPDRGLLASVLKSTYWALWVPEGVDDRVAVATEILELGEQAADRTLALEGRILRLFALIESGDAAAVQREFRRCERSATEIKNRLLLWTIATLRACLAFLEGRLAEAKQLARDAMALGEPSQSDNLAFASMNAHQLGHVLLLRGRFERIELQVQSLISLRPLSGDTYRAVLAFIRAEQGRLEEARSLFETLAAHDFAHVPRRIDWSWTMAFLAEVCALLGDAARAASLYEMLLPLRSRNIMILPQLVFGPADHYLAILAATLSRWDDATCHFDEAIELERRLGTRQLMARTQTSYAAMLMKRDAGGDRSRAAGLLAVALDIANALDLASVTARAAALKSRLAEEDQGTPVPPPREEADTPAYAFVFRREGDIWTIAFGGRVLHLKDAKGLRYIRFLLSHPGRDLPATRIVEAAMEGVESAVDLGSLRDAGPILDGKARTDYRDRLAELRADLEQTEAANDLGRAAAIREEMDRLAEQLSAAFDLGGRPRKFDDPREHARQRVAKGVSAAVERLRRLHPGLAHHLDTHIRTGTFCTYTPDPERPFDWLL